MASMTINTPGTDTAAGAEESTWPRWRVWTIRAWYALLSLLLMAMGGGAVYLVLGLAEADEHFASGSVTVAKYLAMGGVFAICWTGGRSVVAFHFLVVGSVAWSVGGLLWAVPPPDETPVSSALASLVIWFLPLVVLRPHRRDLLGLHLRPSAVLLVLAVLLAVPALEYAVEIGRLTTPNYPKYDMTCLWVVLAAQAVFSALRPRGSRWLPRIIALATVWLGLLALIWPEDATSPGRAWGAAMLIWAMVFAAAAELQNRRSAADHTAGAATVLAEEPGRAGDPVA